MFQPPGSSISPLAEKPSLDTVRTAIKSVLTQDPSVDRKAASDFLESLKDSVHAWEIGDQLLQANESIEISYLAAHMLRQKITRNFNELPTECYSSLKDSILNYLRLYDDYAVQGQLTMAIADLTLLLQGWKNPIEDLAAQLGLDVALLSLANTDYISILRALHNRLIFAYVMHSMCDLNHNSSERPCRIGAKRREEYEDYLISKCGQAISWWLNTLKEIDELQNSMRANINLTQQNNDDNIHRNKCFDLMNKLVGQIYLCYSSWLRIFDEENVQESLPLIDAAFKHLSDINCPHNIHDYAVEVVTATASYTDDNSQVEYLVDHLTSNVLKLEPVFGQARSNEDGEKSSNFVKVFTSVAETACLKHVIQNKDNRLIILLLNCLNHYDYELIEETYPFWWSLLEHLQNQLKSSEYEPFIPYIEKFVMGVIKLCQFDPDEETVVSQEQDIHSFRSNSAEIIVNIMFLTTVEKFLFNNQILNYFSCPLTDPNWRWEYIESILFLLSCLAQMLTREENEIRIKIFEGILAQQQNSNHSPEDVKRCVANKQVAIKIGNAPGEVHPQIVATSLKIIGNFDNFLADYPDYLVLAINYILSSISNEKYRNQLIKPAATTLCSIMELNANRHLSSCPQLILIIKDLCGSLDSFDESAAAELLRCSAYMADAIKDVNIKDQFLCEIISPIMASLKTTLVAPKKEETEPTKYLDRLSSVFRQSDIHPSVAPGLKNFISLVDTELWPMIVKTLEIYASETGHAIERTCRTIRYLIRCLKPEWMIERVAETMIKLYKTYPQNSSPLYICSILVDEFANRTPEINQGLFAMLEIFCELTFMLLNMSSSQKESLLTMKNYPETIDDMMRLFNRFLRKCPNDFVNCKALESIIELSISSLRLDHQEANQNVSKFVNSFIGVGQMPEYSHIGDVIRNILGARITNAVINACLFDIPTVFINEEAQILLTLYSFDKVLFEQWVAASILSLPRTNIQGIECVTEKQLEEFKQTLVSGGSLKRIINCLRSFARLYN